jgi:hypothetical protein
MSRIIALLVLVAVALNAQDVREHTSADKKWASDLVAPYGGLATLRQHCLSQPALSPEIRQAIEERVVIPGMCALEAFAAAGLPTSYGIHEEAGKRVFRVSVITEECEHPHSDVTIDLRFKNATQFHTPKPMVFRAHFEMGRVVSVDKSPRLGIPRQVDE